MTYTTKYYYIVIFIIKRSGLRNYNNSGHAQFYAQKVGRFLFQN